MFTDSMIICLFLLKIHVPKLDMPYSALQLAQALKKVIAEMLEQVRENDRKQNSI